MGEERRLLVEVASSQEGGLLAGETENFISNCTSNPAYCLVTKYKLGLSIELRHFLVRQAIEKTKSINNFHLPRITFFTSKSIIYTTTSYNKY